MPDRSFLSWPFFEDRHRELAERIESFCESHFPFAEYDIEEHGREIVGLLGDWEFLELTGVDPEVGGSLDFRSLCIVR